MALRYAVGIKVGNKADQVTVEAEDALIAALKVKVIEHDGTGLDDGDAKGIHGCPHHHR